jgi:nicotinate phosphoribosyltransferase
MTLAPPELLTDRYELAMADSYVAAGIAGDRVAFELFVRDLPAPFGYLLVAGLESVASYLQSLRFGAGSLAYLEEERICGPAALTALAQLRFDGDVDAVAEGSIVFAGEPLVRVEGSRLACQLVESHLLNQVNFQTLIATKAARMVDAAAGRPVVDFGYRRAHGSDAGLLAARSAYLGGCIGTATVAAGYLWGIPTLGTMAHSYVMAFTDEVTAFRRFLRDRPGESTLLIDTYDAVAGATAAVEASRAEGIVPQMVRIDSGNAAELARAVRAVLDAGGLRSTGIFRSGDLDEYEIARLVAWGAPIDGFGVGTRLTTGWDVPALGGVYKLVESAGRPVMKTSPGKATLPGRHQVFRGCDGDVIGLAGEQLAGRALLEPVLRAGEPAAEVPGLQEIRGRAERERTELAAEVRRAVDPLTRRPRHSEQLAALVGELV